MARLKLTREDRVAVTYRIPKPLYKEIVASARRRKQSVNNEVVQRLKLQTELSSIEDVVRFEIQDGLEVVQKACDVAITRALKGLGNYLVDNQHQHLNAINSMVDVQGKTDDLYRVVLRNDLVATVASSLAGKSYVPSVGAAYERSLYNIWAASSVNGTVVPS